MNYKKYLPHSLIIILGIVLPMLYFSPLIQGDKALLQADIVNYIGGAHQLKEYEQTNGHSTYWIDNTFSGMPTYQFGAKYNYDLVRWIDDCINFLPRPASYIFIMMLGFYLLILALTRDWKPAIMGSLFFAFSTYFFICLAAGHNAKVHAIAYIPLTLAGILWGYNKKYLWGFILTLLGMALQIKANHFQMTYYMGLSLLFLGGVLAYQSFIQKTIKQFLLSSSIIVLALFLALGLNSNRLLTTYEYVEHSNRSATELQQLKNDKDTNSGMNKDAIFAWSYGIGETLNLAFPNLYGGGSEHLLNYQGSEILPAYWGDQPITSPNYQGIIVIFLAILAMFTLQSYHKWWLFGASLFSIILAWGHNFSFFNNLMVDYFPMYSKFRAVTSVLVIAETCLPVLAALGVWNLISHPSEANTKKILMVSGSFLAISIVFLLFGSSIFDFESANDKTYLTGTSLEGSMNEIIQNAKAQRYSLLRGDAIKSIFLISIVGGILYYIQKNKHNTSWINIGAYVVITIIGLADLWFVNKEYLNDSNFVDTIYTEQPYITDVSPNLLNAIYEQPKLQQLVGQQLIENEPVFSLVEINKQLEKIQKLDTSRYRVSNQILGYNEAHTAYYNASLGGYFAVKLRRYQELIEHHLSKNNPEVINMLNTKYLLNQNPAATSLDSLFLIQENTSANGNAWFVKDVQIAKNADEEILALNTIKTNTTAVINVEKKGNLDTHYKTDSVNTITYIPNKVVEPQKLTYNSQTNSKQLAVFSEIYYPGWNAYIDGKPTTVYPVNYVLRAVEIPSGKHQIEFKFEPSVVQNGVYLSIVFIIISLIIISILFIFQKKITHEL